MASTMPGYGSCRSVTATAGRSTNWRARFPKTDFNASLQGRPSVTQIPARAAPFARQTRKLIEDAERAAAMHNGDLTDYARLTLVGRKQRDHYFDPMLFSNPAW